MTTSLEQINEAIATANGRADVDTAIILEGMKALVLAINELTSAVHMMGAK